MKIAAMALLIILTCAGVYIIIRMFVDFCKEQKELDEIIKKCESELHENLHETNKKILEEARKSLDESRDNLKAANDILEKVEAIQAKLYAAYGKDVVDKYYEEYGDKYCKEDDGDADEEESDDGSQFSEEYEPIDIFEKPCLLSRDPDSRYLMWLYGHGWQVYWLRGRDDDPEMPGAIDIYRPQFNMIGAIITKEKLLKTGEEYRDLERDDVGYPEDDQINIDQYMDICESTASYADAVEHGLWDDKENNGVFMIG